MSKLENVAIAITAIDTKVKKLQYRRAQLIAQQERIVKDSKLTGINHDSYDSHSEETVTLESMKAQSECGKSTVSAAINPRVVILREESANFPPGCRTNDQIINYLLSLDQGGGISLDLTGYDIKAQLTLSDAMTRLGCGRITVV